MESTRMSIIITYSRYTYNDGILYRRETIRRASLRYDRFALLTILPTRIYSKLYLLTYHITS